MPTACLRSYGVPSPISSSRPSTIAEVGVRLTSFDTWSSVDGPIWTIRRKRMTTTMSKTTRSAGFQSLDEEVRLESVPVTGTVPAWMSGSLVRVTPALMDGAGKSIKHWFDGAAMLNAFGFGDGGVSYASRFLDTDYL